MRYKNRQATNISPFILGCFCSGAIHVWNEQSVDLFLGYVPYMYAIYATRGTNASTSICGWLNDGGWEIIRAGNNTMWEELVPFCVGAGKSSSGNEIHFISVRVAVAMSLCTGRKCI